MNRLEGRAHHRGLHQGEPAARLPASLLVEAVLLARLSYVAGLSYVACAVRD